MTRKLRICREGEIAEGGVRIVQDGPLEIGVFFHGGSYHAYRNLCPHQGGPACEGRRMFGVRDRIDDQGRYLGQAFDEDDLHIVCPWHGYEYHIETGENVCDPALRLRRFEVSQEEGEVYVHV